MSPHGQLASLRITLRRITDVTRCHAENEKPIESRTLLKLPPPAVAGANLVSGSVCVLLDFIDVACKDQPGAVPPHPLHADLVRPSDLR